MLDELADETRRPPARRPAQAGGVAEPVVVPAPGPARPRPLSPAHFSALQRVVGNRRAGMALAGAPVQRLAVQRLAVTTAPEDDRTYARSDDHRVVTGLDNPNHELLVADTGAIGEINTAIRDSPLAVVPGAKRTLFTTGMTEVRLAYSSARRPAEARGHWQPRPFSQGVPENLQARYEKHILPNIIAYRTTIRANALNEMYAEKLTLASTCGIATRLEELSGSLGRFRNVVAAELAGRGDFPGEVHELTRSALDVLIEVESALAEESVTKARLRYAATSMSELPFFSARNVPPSLVRLALRVHREVTALSELVPEAPLSLLPFQVYNFNRQLLGQLHTPDNVALYRACDVQASTLLGNSLTEKNAHRLKTYNTGNGKDFHYATKILSSGADWVSLEHFAASQRERRISGLGDGDMFKNLDHTWQFLMMGTSGSGARRSTEDEDRYFERYTRIVYYLDNLVEHERGGFSTALRDRIADRGGTTHVQLSSSSQLANVMGWRAFYRKVADRAEENRLIDLIVAMEKAVGADEVSPLQAALRSWDDLVKEIG
ncbi:MULTISPECIES: hypothetical protein [Actinosynnema]|uniref:hypothetical protein n=1 Tax=Actinosynnema TaxID=40566 RepID=UPI0020A52FB3|nr:hypothetical protein [Actinosynnema pretiosum]MCP2092627.1 hypothetical protein [Actinosynnema pretiosum]